MNIVTIKEVKGVVTCADDGTAEHVFNVKNATDKALKVGLHLSTDDPTRADWLEIDGATEHELDVETMTQVAVKIRVPAEGSPGEYSYRLRVFDPDMPGENYTDGDPVFFQVPDREEKTEVQEISGKQPFKWWIPVAIAVAVIVVGAVVWLAWPSGIKLPDFTLAEWDQAKAEQFLKDNNLAFKTELQQDPNPLSGKEILGQVPVAETKLKKEDSVILKIAAVKVPRLKDSSFSQALQRISANGLSFNDRTDLKIVTVSKTSQHEKVLNQTPGQGQLVAKHTAVKLSVGRLANKKFVIKALPQVKTMQGIKMSPAFITREVAPAPE